MTLETSETALIIPVKDFQRAKIRLSPRLDPEARADLARKMATHVVGISKPFVAHIACDDAAVAAWAKDLGAQVIWCEGTGLNGAVEKAAETLGHMGYKEAIVAHSDLPNAQSFLAVLGDTQITIVADHRGVGTNVLRIPLKAGFTFGYGHNSFAYHLKEAERLGLSINVLNESALELDIDIPADLDLLQK